MKSLSLIFSAVLALAVSASNSNQTSYNTTVQAEYYFACAKGFMAGMELGLYTAQKTYTVPALCLGADAVVEGVQLADYFSGDSDVTIIEALKSFYTLYYHVDKYCVFGTILHDVLNFIANPNNDTSATTLL